MLGAIAIASASVAENAINQSIDLSANAPNQYMQCLTNEALTGQRYGQAKKVCKQLLQDALAEIPDIHRGTFADSAKAMFESGELISNDRHSQRAERAESHIAKAERQRRAYERDVADGRTRDERGIGNALDQYVDCVSHNPRYLENLENAKAACTTERTYAETLIESENSAEVLQIVDRVVDHKWRRATEISRGIQ